MIDLIQILSVILGLAIGFVVLMIPAIAEPMARLFILLPILFVALTGIAGYFIGKNLSAAYMRKNAKKVKIDLAEVPLIAKMLDRGWFFFQVTQGVPRVSFGKKKQFRRLFKEPMELEGIDDEIPLDNINI